MSFSQDEFNEFKIEALELLEIAEKSLLALDEGGEFRGCFDAVFRGFHNLKGAAGMMELTDLQNHTHELETILMGFKKEDSMPRHFISFFLRGIDASRALLDGQTIQFDYKVINAGSGPVTPTSINAKLTPSVNRTSGENHHKEELTSNSEIRSNPTTTAQISKEAIEEFLNECNENVERISKNLHAFEAGESKKEFIDEIFRDIHSLKGSSYLYSYNLLGKLAHALESSFENVRLGTHAISKDLLNASFMTLGLIEKIVEGIKRGGTEGDQAREVDSLVQCLQAANETMEILSSTRPAAEPVQIGKARFAEEGGLEIVNGGSKNSDSTNRESNFQGKEREADAASSIRVPVALLDNLMNLMGEMVLVRNQVLQYSNGSEDLDFLSMSKRLNVVTSEIQGELMKTRMQPIGNILGKFSRVVRDLSQELNKKINLQLFGVETELDKSLLEAIKDPLTHIVRNSCDHGIERPEVRRQAGKPEVGNISIKAYHEGGQVIIDIYDDGKGLNPDLIRQKAIEKGLISSVEAAKLSEKDILSLIFAPGFSTASQVTNVSGRGVGMDVVRTNIEKIGGNVDLSSVAGFGTSIKLKIPLTLAIIPALIVKCGQGIYAIPQLKLEELVRVDQSSGESRIEFLHGTPIYRLRQNILPLVDLRQVLKLDEAKTGNSDIINIAVLNDDRGSFGLIIDEICDTADIVVKPINRLLKSLQIYSGATMLGDGSVALILDVLGLSKVAKLERERASQVEVHPQSERRLRTSKEQQSYLLVELKAVTKHALVLGYVYRLEEFQRNRIEYLGTRPVVRYGKTVLPLISVSEKLGYCQGHEFNDIISVVVVQRAGSLYGLVVERVLDIFNSSGDLDSTVDRQLGIYGSLSTEDELLVVINPFEIIEGANLGNTAATGTVLKSQSAPMRGAVPRAEPNNVRAINFKTTASVHGRILLAEDTLFFRKAMSKILENQGYEVISAVDGKEAYELLTQSEAPFDLIVSDIEMPRTNGFQLAEMVRQNPHTSHLPLLAISSRAENDFVAEGKKAGFDVFLEKLQPDVLVGAVTDLLNRKRGVA